MLINTLETYYDWLNKEAAVKFKGVKKMKAQSRHKLRQLNESKPSTNRVPVTGKSTVGLNVNKMLDSSPVTLPEKTKLSLDMTVKSNLPPKEKVKKAKKKIQESIPEGNVLRDLSIFADNLRNRLSGVGRGIGEVNATINDAYKVPLKVLKAIGITSVPALGLKSFIEYVGDRIYRTQQEMASKPIVSKAKKDIDKKDTDDKPKTLDIAKPDASYLSWGAGGAATGALAGLTLSLALKNQRNKKLRNILIGLGIGALGGVGSAAAYNKLS